MRKLKLYLMIFAVSVPVFISTKALAISAWTRKYKTPCSTCHRPNIPRLNPEGQRFRKYGYRFPDEMNKEPEYKEIGNYLAVRGRTTYSYSDPDKQVTARDDKTVSRFENNATLFYAGPVTPNLTAFFEAEWDDKADIELNGYMSWIQGTANNYWSARLGQMHTLARVGWAGFDRPSVISTTKVLSTKLTNSPVPFMLNQDQRGLELSWGNSDCRVIGQVLNGINYAGSGNSGTENDTDKDVLLAYEHIADSKGSGFTLLAYRGVWHADPTSVVNLVTLRDDPDFNKFTFYRYGATFSLVMDLFSPGYSEIQGGVILSRDDVPQNYPTAGGVDVSGQAYFIDLEQYYKNASAFLRVDFLQLNLTQHEWETTYRIGTAYMVNDNLRLAGEVFFTDNNRLTGVDVPGATLEAMLNF